MEENGVLKNEKETFNSWWKNIHGREKALQKRRVCACFWIAFFADVAGRCANQTKQAVKYDKS